MLICYLILLIICFIIHSSIIFTIMVEIVDIPLGENPQLHNEHDHLDYILVIPE